MQKRKRWKGNNSGYWLTNDVVCTSVAGNMWFFDSDY